MSPVLIWLLVILSLAMSVQAAHTLYLMLYTWDRSDTYEAARAPQAWRPPRLSFSVLLPARHEEEVIGRTIERVLKSAYPRKLIEAIVICEIHDTGTIRAAQDAIDALAAQGIHGARIITFDDGPINKPHGLNKGLAEARNQVVTIFDAEDEIHPEIFNVVNTVMLNEGVRVVQSGVQLMNFASTWFSAHNVLEYYFWFKSRLHVHAKNGMTPLGGNTVFFATSLVREIGGWDERNLTEDADIGIGLSVHGERVRVVYDDAYVTQEETPPDLKSFIKQRTRWNQGFLQTLKKGDWWKVPSLRNRLTALYILAFPFLQTILAIYVPISLAMILTVKLPVLITFPLLLPSYLLFAHFLLSVVGLHEFAETHNLRLPRPWVRTMMRLFVTYFPYQWVLGFASANAVWRELRGVNNWEKTAHVGAHREITSYAHATERLAGVALAEPDDAHDQEPLPPAPVLPATGKSPRLVKAGAASVLLLGLVSCATALGPLHPLGTSVAANVGRTLPLTSLLRLPPVQGTLLHFRPLLTGHRTLPNAARSSQHRARGSFVSARHVSLLPHVSVPRPSRSHVQMSSTTNSSTTNISGSAPTRLAVHRAPHLSAPSLRLPVRSMATFYRHNRSPHTYRATTQTVIAARSPIIVYHRPAIANRSQSVRVPALRKARSYPSTTIRITISAVPPSHVRRSAVARAQPYTGSWKSPGTVYPVVPRRSVAPPTSPYAGQTAPNASIAPPTSSGRQVPGNGD